MRWTRLLLAAFAWVLAAAVGLSTAADTAIGPVVLVLTPTHGIHLGDVVACVGAAAMALLITLLLLLPPRSSSQAPQ